MLQESDERTLESLQENDRLSFDAYEAFCNENNVGSRKNGILSDEIFNEVMNDPSTVFARLDGVNVPVLIDMKYGLGLGYDEDRARSYADPDMPVSALAVPLGELTEDDKTTIIDVLTASTGRSIFYADNGGRDAQVLTEGLNAHGINAVELPLLDRRCRPENRQASLSLYICDTMLKNAEGDDSAPVPLSMAQEHFDSITRLGIEDPENAVMLRNGASFTAAELDDMWDLYTDKFQLLGENHPISMEDGKDDFLSVLTSPSTTVSVSYENGKPVCFADFTDNLDDLYWLNTPYLNDLANEKTSLTPIFFPGIVAGKAGGNHAAEVIRLFADETGKAGINSRIIFENTNLSEMYVPRIVFDSTVDSAYYDVEKPHKVDQTHYRLAII